MEPMSVFLVALMIIPFMLFILRIALISWHNMMLARQLKEEEGRQCAQVSVVNNSATVGGNVPNTVSNNDMKNDLPPSYDDVVQNYINAKEALQAAEEGAVGGGLQASAAPSTLTIATVISDNASANDITAITTTTTNIVTCAAGSSNSSNNNNSADNNNNNNH